MQSFVSADLGVQSRVCKACASTDPQAVTEHRDNRDDQTDHDDHDFHDDHHDRDDHDDLDDHDRPPTMGRPSGDLQETARRFSSMADSEF